MELILSFIWLAAVVWLISRAVIQRNLFVEIPAHAISDEDCPAVSIVVPARDEASNIADCLQSLLAQRYPQARYSVLVVDDHSADDTAAIVAALAKRTSLITLLRAPPLPAGWTGKSHACWLGSRAAPASVQWLCFIDADVRAQPLFLSSAVAVAARDRIDLLSLAPRHDLGSFAERLILPCGHFLLAFCQDLRTRESRSSDDVAVTGQCMLVRREVYETTGGHAVQPGDICEDLGLARRFRRGGYTVTLRAGNGLLSTRMYTGWKTLWPGLAKNLAEMLGGPLQTIATAIIAMLLAWAAVIVPVIDAFAFADRTWGSGLALVLALVASAAAFGFHIAGAVHFRIPFWFGFLFPLAYTTGALMALDSVRWRWRRCIVWKGRSYP